MPPLFAGSETGASPTGRAEDEFPVDDLTYLPILKRVGTVLLAAGLLDVGLMVYYVIGGISYTSSFSRFNIFAIIGGIFLRGGSLRAAGIVAWLAVLFLTGAICDQLLVWSLFMPPDLMLAELRLSPLSVLESLIWLVAPWGLLVWVVQQLRKEAVLTALARGGLKIRSMRLPFIVGAASSLLLVFLLASTLNGKTAKQAIEVAAGQLGKSYRYHLDSLKIVKNAQGTFVTGSVTAWNDREIREVPVEWKEK